ncbi:acrB/AcrD/AcrF family protein, partial [Vibrio parahaemolyticus V-223/04]
KTWRH